MRGSRRLPARRCRLDEGSRAPESDHGHLPKIEQMAPKTDTRCPWAANELMWSYHDREWGLPVHDDRTHFEFLILEGAQAGLSWSTILNRRDGYRRCFANF